MLRALSLLLIAAVAGCGGCPGAEECPVGERDVGGVCTQVDRFYVNIDERRDVRDDTSRNGVGVNACAFRGDAPLPERSVGACDLLRYPGESAATAFVGDAGEVRVELSEDPVRMLPDPDSHCYQKDLFPTRGDLFAPGDAVDVTGSGGNDIGTFALSVTAPETLLLEPPGEVVSGEDLTFAWVEGAAEQIYVLAHSYDADADESIDVQCLFDDGAGTGTIPADLMSELRGDEVNLFFLRQNWAHAEPEDAEVAVDVFISSSVIRSLPLP